MLERENEQFRVRTAHSADEGLALLENSGTIDCVITDYDMPRTDGLEFLEAVRDEYPELPFILFTGKGSEEIASEAISAGVTDYLQKGGREVYRVLANRIEHAVEQYRVRRETEEMRRWYRSLFEYSHDVLLVLDAEGAVQYYSPALTRILGYPSDEADSTNVFEYIHPEDRDRVRDQFRSLVDRPEKTVTEIEFRVQHADGSWRWVEATGSNETNTVLDGYLVTLRDVTDQKDRERELERYQTIVETAGDSVYVLDTEGRFRMVNEHLCTRTGYDREELLGEPVSVLLDSESIEQGEEVIREIVTTDTTDVGELEATVETNEGETFPVEIRIAPLTDATGTFQGTVGISRDISARNERERDLERYERILETMGDAVFALDTGGCMLEVNEGMERLTGYTREELLGEHVSLFVDEDDLARGEEMIRELLRSGETDVETFEQVIHTADGDTVRGETTLTLLLTDGGEFRGTVGTVRDITDRKQREQSIEDLHTTTQRFARATSKEQIADLVVDASREILELPTCAVWLYDDETDELQPTAWTDETVDVVGELQTFGAGEGLAWEAFATGTSKSFDNVSTDPERYNPETDIRAEIILPLGDHGILMSGSTEPGVFDDITVSIAEVLTTNAEAAFTRAEREETLRHREQELRRQNERLDEFVGIVSHDLRNPLNLAQGHLDLVQMECESDHLDTIEDAHTRIRNLIENLLALAKNGGSVTDPDLVDLAEVVSQCWQTVDGGRATLRLDVDDRIYADRSRLRQLLENLFRNAIEHGGPDVTVTVETTENGFYVEDDGPGLPPDEREVVFESGYTATETGTGFGLSIVRQIADAHDWTVTATNGRAGGARFEVSDVEFDE